jgi:hypothetical protein
MVCVIRETNRSDRNAALENFIGSPSNLHVAAVNVTAPSLHLLLWTIEMSFLYASAIFLSAALLFCVELMAAKMVLPKFGGGPAIWNTCVLFFQMFLLLGYGYAHLLARRLGLRRVILLHVAVILLPLLALPLGIPEAWVPAANVNPALCLLGYLLIAAGLPFFVVCTTAPLLQNWFAATQHARARDPYFLYAASNLGSFVGLIGYPVALEPYVGVRLQGWLWEGGYILLVVLLLACAVLAWRTRVDLTQHPESEDKPVQAPNSATRAYWVLLAFVPSSLMLGATTYFTTEIAPMPMLWVLPLGLYLLSLIIAFGKLPARVLRGLGFLLPFLMLWVAWIMTSTDVETDKVYGAMKRLIPMHLITFFVAALVLHGRLAKDRPPVQHLTEFYLWIALGGALGGTFNSLVAPLVFSSSVEYPLVLLLAVLLTPPWRKLAEAAIFKRPDFIVPVLSAVLAAGLLGANFLGPRHGGFQIIHRERNFFGIITIDRNERGHFCRFYHGKTLHGMQCQDSASTRRVPLLYFYLTGPLGQTFVAFSGEHAKKHVAVVGLGAGTLATYGMAGQEFNFFEIDPAVERAARQYFSFLSDSRASCRVILGDGRLTVAREQNGYYGMIVLDAFASDSLPAHLITTEAMQTYLKKLEPDGILVANISNNYIDLESVLAGVARDAGLTGLVQLDDRITDRERTLGKTDSHWVLLARDPAHFGKLRYDRRWRPLRGRKIIPGWTDDYSNLYSVLNWN